MVVVVASANGIVGIEESMRVLKAGVSAVDAVETGIRQVEANPGDHTVGCGGYPNLLGQVELDASIMNGRDLTAGAVGAMRGYKHPISVARKVMEHLPHVFLVGQGAEHFAAEMGFERCDLLTEEARRVWEQRLLADMPQETVDRLSELPDLWRWVEIATDPERVEEFVRFFDTDPEPAMGTVNFIARDFQGNICAGASTSGWAWKYPGRLGDSPVIGAGVYADNRYGATTCTGMGEMAIRASTARSVVFYLQMGLSLVEAGRQAMKDLNDLGGRYLSRMSFIAMDRDGRHIGFSNAQDRTYIYQTGDMAWPEKMPYTFVQAKRRWGERDQWPSPTQ
jgi:beta-aspartyl-peptidase (threonine type)